MTLFACTNVVRDLGIAKLQLFYTQCMCTKHKITCISERNFETQMHLLVSTTFTCDAGKGRAKDQLMLMGSVTNQSHAWAPVE